VTAPTLTEEDPQKQDKTYSSQLMTEQKSARTYAEKTVRKQEHHKRERMQNRDERGPHAR